MGTVNIARTRTVNYWMQLLHYRCRLLRSVQSPDLINWVVYRKLIKEGSLLAGELEKSECMINIALIFCPMPAENIKCFLSAVLKWVCELHWFCGFVFILTDCWILFTAKKTDGGFSFLKTIDYCLYTFQNALLLIVWITVFIGITTINHEASV